MPSLTSVIKQASRGADLYFVFRFLRLLTMKWTATDAYKYKIIDKKGNALRKSSELESVNEKAAYTMLHRMVFKIRRLIEKVPIVGKSILLNYAAALFLLKEQKDTRIWTDEKYMTRKLMEFLETDWSADAEFLQEEIKNKYGKTSASEFLVEEVEIDEDAKMGKQSDDQLRKLYKTASEKDQSSPANKSFTKRVEKEMKKRGIKEEVELEVAPPGWEGTVKAMKKKKGIDNPWALAWHMHNKGNKPRIPEEKEIEEMQMENTEKKVLSFGEFQLNEISMEAGKVYHQDTSDGPMYFKAVEQQKNKRWKGLVLDIGKKKPKSGSADEKLRFWKATPDKDIPPSLKEEVGYEPDVEKIKISDEDEQDDTLRMQKVVYATEEVTAMDYDRLKKGDIITITFKSAMSSGKSKFKVTAKNIVGKAKVGKVTLQNLMNPRGVKHYLYKRGNKVSFAQGDMGASVERYTIEQVELDEMSAGLQLKMAFDDAKIKIKGTKGGKLVIAKKDEKKVEKVIAKQMRKPSDAKRILGSQIVFEDVELDEKRKAADDVGMECQECLHKFRHKNPVYGKTKCPKCKSTDLDLAFGEEVDEEVPTVSTAGVAGLDTGLTFKKKKEDEKKAKILRRKIIGEIKMTKFAGKDVFIVDSDIYHACRLGKKKYHQYEKYVGSDTIGLAIREFGLKYPKRPIILQNGESGPMLYLKYGRS